MNNPVPDPPDPPRDGMNAAAVKRATRKMEHKAFRKYLQALHARNGDSFPLDKISLLMGVGQELNMKINDQKLHLDSIRKDHSHQQARAEEEASQELDAAKNKIGKDLWIKRPLKPYYRKAYIDSYDKDRHQHLLVFYRDKKKEFREWVNLDEVLESRMSWTHNPHRKPQSKKRKKPVRSNRNGAAAHSDETETEDEAETEDETETEDSPVLRTDCLRRKVDEAFSMDPVDQIEAERAILNLEVPEQPINNDRDEPNVSKEPVGYGGKEGMEEEETDSDEIEFENVMQDPAAGQSDDEQESESD